MFNSKAICPVSTMWMALVERKEGKKEK